MSRIRSCLSALRFWQTLAALAAVAAAIVAARRHWWPFDGQSRTVRPSHDPSLWQYLFSDRITLGFVRGVIAALVLYVAASIPALIFAGRWLRAFGTSGLSADLPQVANETIGDLKNQVDTLQKGAQLAETDLERLRRQRDAYANVARRLLRDRTTSTTGGIRTPAERPIVKDDEEGTEPSNEHERDPGSESETRED